MDLFALAAYSIGLLGWFFVWYMVDGHSLMRLHMMVKAIFLIGIFVFVVNIVLALFAHIPEYDVELKLYEYVENNAKTVASLTLAVALFVIVRRKTSSMDFLRLVMCSFLFASLGVLALYWMPARVGWLTALRHIKSVFYFYGLLLLGAAIVVFLSGLKKKC